MRQETVLQPGEARPFLLPAGARLWVRDERGHQAAELYAFTVDDPAEHLDCAVTMEVTGRLFPTERSKFYSNRYEPLLTLLRDEVGCHDLLHPPGSASARALFLGESGERTGTAESVLAALDGTLALPGALPRPVHLFRRTTVDADGNLALMETPSEAGQGVHLQAERDLQLVVAVSDDEISPLTGCDPSPIAVIIEGVV